MSAPAGVRTLDDLEHADLATLAREWLLAGHLIDRAGMPHVIAAHGRDAMEAVAIAEWMGASPVYSRRMQQVLGFDGDDVATMFKGMQLDIGAPPEFLDFRYRVLDASRGEFWLDHCGALMDVEPMGEDFVVAMCHHIEDPTFEATAAASNPRARLSPIHRPPRVPADRHPHCHWTVEIDDSAEPLALPDAAAAVASTLAARSPLAGVDPPGAGPGRDDYSGELDPDLRMEDFSAAALRAISAEVALQGHLLALSFNAAVGERHGAEDADALSARQFVGVSGLVADRIARAFDVDRDTVGVAQVLELHPAFHPACYVQRSLDLDGGELRVELAACPATSEAGPRSWWSLDDAALDRALAAVVRAVDDTATVRAEPGAAEVRRAWVVGTGGDPVDEDPDVTLTRFSQGSAFEFRRTGPRAPAVP